MWYKSVPSPKEVTLDTRQPKKDEVELLNAPLIKEQLPIRFESGFEFRSFGGQCAKCGARLSEDRVHGKVDTSFTEIGTIEAIGYCPPCNLWTRLNIRVKGDKTYTTLGPDGEWLSGTFEPRVKSLSQKIARQAKRLLNFK